jgi:hypothetical protein
MRLLSPRLKVRFFYGASGSLTSSTLPYLSPHESTQPTVNLEQHASRGEGHLSVGHRLKRSHSMRSKVALLVLSLALLTLTACDSNAPIDPLSVRDPA